MIGIIVGAGVGGVAVVVGLAWMYQSRMAGGAAAAGPTAGARGGSVYNAFAQSPPQQRQQTPTGGSGRKSSWGFYMYQKQPSTPGAGSGAGASLLG